MLKAVTRKAASVDAKLRAINDDRDAKHQISTAYFFDHFATPEDIAVMVTEQDFMEAHRELIPSVSVGELAHYEKVRAAFEGGAEKQSRPVLSRPQPVSSWSNESKTSFKEKGKTSVKGKGKAIALDTDDEYDDEDESAVNGRAKGKGKAPAEFHDEAGDDDLF